MKKAISLIATGIILFSLLACTKKEEQSVPQPSPPPMRQGPIIETPAIAPGHETIGKKTEFQVVVSPEVEEQWSAVKLIVEDKELNKTYEFIVNIGEEFKIPDSELTVKIIHFLPDFKMSGQIITSASNEPNNPSAGVVIYDDDKQIFPASGKWGWLYANFPTIHPFQHERFGLILKEGVRK
jgi:hypothetical protein